MNPPLQLIYPNKNEEKNTKIRIFHVLYCACSVIHIYNVRVLGNTPCSGGGEL
jgi:hypothetical protein